MTKVRLLQTSDALECNAEGHAGFAPKGQDIACAAVSVLMRTALQVLAHDEGVELVTDTESRGRIYFKATVKEAGSVSGQRLRFTAEFLSSGLSGAARDFPENIMFEYNLEA